MPACGRHALLKGNWADREAAEEVQGAGLFWTYSTKQWDLVVTWYSCCYFFSNVFKLYLYMLFFCQNKLVIQLSLLLFFVSCFTSLLEKARNSLCNSHTGRLLPCVCVCVCGHLGFCHLFFCSSLAPLHGVSFISWKVFSLFNGHSTPSTNT